MLDRRTLLTGALARPSPVGPGGAPCAGRGQRADPHRRLNPITGWAALRSGMQKMIVAVAEAVNAAGGAPAVRSRSSREDTPTNPQAAVLAAKKLIEANKDQRSSAPSRRASRWR